MHQSATTINNTRIFIIDHLSQTHSIPANFHFHFKTKLEFLDLSRLHRLSFISEDKLPVCYLPVANRAVSMMAIKSHSYEHW